MMGPVKLELTHFSEQVGFSNHFEVLLLAPSRSSKPAAAHSGISAVYPSALPGELTIAKF